jgi:putative redox protein
MSKEMMSSTVKWLNNMKFEGVDSCSHPIPMEATIRFGGSGANPMPLELLLSSLGGCIGVDTKYLLKQNGKDYRSFEVRIEGIRRNELPRPFEKIHAHVKIAGDLDAHTVKSTLDLVMTKMCPIAVIVAATTDLTWDFELTR